MNYLDMQRAVDWIETRWGSGKAWNNWEALQPDFANYTPGTVMEVLHTIYTGGSKYPPSPSEVLAAAGSVQLRRIQAGIDETEYECTSHTWAADPEIWECVNCGETTPAPECGHPYKGRECVYCEDDA